MNFVVFVVELGLLFVEIFDGFCYFGCGDELVVFGFFVLEFGKFGLYFL